MGGVCCSEKIFPSGENRLKRSDSMLSDDNLKERRTTTDSCFLLVQTTFMLVLFCLVGYCVAKGDIYRLINGYDNCGRVCGQNTSNYQAIENTYCQNLQHGQYYIVVKRATYMQDVKDRICVDNCENYGYEEFLNRCFPKKGVTSALKTDLNNFFHELAQDLHSGWPKLCYLCLISLAISAGFLILFRFFVGVIVWIVLIGTMIASVIASAYLWATWSYYKNLRGDADSTTQMYLGFAIGGTFVAFIVVCIMVLLRKQIKLVVQLFIEAGKAIEVMPLLLFEPILTFVSVAILIVLWAYFSLWIESAGTLTETDPQAYYYQKNNAIIFTRWYNFVALIWMAQFANGCQHMVIAGAVSKWYFTRDKTNLKSPIWESMYNLVRYHLGSVALGSFIITVIRILRILLRNLIRKLERIGVVQCILKCLDFCCLSGIENILKYWTRNAYIEIAMHGYPFCVAGKQAFTVLTSNVLRVATINSVGDFILFLCKIVIVTLTVLIGIQMFENQMDIQNAWVLVLIAGLFAYCVANCFLAVYEMAIDTIFLCFCEDCEDNDGVTSHYFMSRSLMNLVELSDTINKQQRIATVSASVEQDNTNANPL